MIKIAHLYVSYRSFPEDVEAVLDSSLTIEKGTISALVGESGSGKSTLLMAILSLLPSGTMVRGKIIYQGKDILKCSEDELRKIRWKKIALIPQGAMNSLTPVISVGNQISEILSFHEGITGPEAKKRTADLLERSGLEPSVANRYPHELSGGQKQRVAIAMALTCDPDFLLADEPTTALDVITQGEIVSALADIVKNTGMGMLLVTHDLPLATSVADNISVMKDGRIVEQGSTGEILQQPRHFHTKDLISALRDIEGGESV